MSIRDRRILNGQLPPRQSRLVTQWATEREAELLAAWARASRDEAPRTIEPL